MLPFAQWPSVNCLNNYADDLLGAPLTIQGGGVRVPEAPGLGITLDEAAIERYRAILQSMRRRGIEPTDPPIFAKNAQTGLDEAVKTLFPDVIFGNLLGEG